MRHTLPKPLTWWHKGPERAVYRVHCFTWSMAQDIAGSASNCSRVDMSEPIPQGARFTFRALPGHRSAAAQVLRQAVAARITQERKQ